MDKTPEMEQFIQMRVEGHSFKVISEMINVSKPTLINWSRNFKFEIDNLRALEIDRIKSNFLFRRETNLEFLLKISSKVDEELGQRDFTKVPTEKLLRLSLEIRSQINDLGTAKITHELNLGEGIISELSKTETIVL